MRPKEDFAVANRQKLLHRPLGPRALGTAPYQTRQPGCTVVASCKPRWRVWHCILSYSALRNHLTGVCGRRHHRPVDSRPPLARLFDEITLRRINYDSGLVAAVVDVLMIATAPEEFGVPECTTTLAAAGLEGLHRCGIILLNSSRVSLLIYKAIVAVRYPELVLHDSNPIHIGHFVPHDQTVEHGGFRTVLWDAPKDLRSW